MNSKNVFIVAEAGINHGGSLVKAIALADEAKKANADAVKFQTFKQSEVNYPNITYKETEKLKIYCDMIGITFFSTPHSFSAVDFLADLKVPLMKIAAPALFKRPFARYVIDKRIPIILSVNQNAMQSDLGWFFANRNVPKTWCLHTISKYPCEFPQLVNIELWRNKNPHKTWGYSDHGEGYDFCIEAVRDYNARIIEEHFKLDDDCVDYKVSIEPFQFKEMVREIREVEKAKNKTPETD